MIELNTEAFDMAIRGLEAELKHTLVPIVAEAKMISDTMEKVIDFLYNKPQREKKDAGN